MMDFDQLENNIVNKVCRLINIANLHQKTFSEFKNKFYGKTVVLVGAGPTLNYFKPIKNAIYVGVNRAFLKKDIKFDYLFTLDKCGLITDTDNYISRFMNYRGNKCVKFVGDQGGSPETQIPEGKIIGQNVRRYKTTCFLMDDKFTLDIESEPLGNFSSVTLPAIQFILYTNPKKVYLVGIDCTANKEGHFTGGMSYAPNRPEEFKMSDAKSVDAWKNLVFFKNIYYPDTEIISVNPVGLKGVFKDIYTDEYYRSKLIQKNYFSTLADKMQNKKVILYGAGKFLKEYKKYVDLSKLNIIGVSDKRFLDDNSKLFKTFMGYKKILPSEINNYNPDCVLVSTVRDKEMIDVLKKSTLKNSSVEIESLYRKV